MVTATAGTGVAQQAASETVHAALCQAVGLSALSFVIGMDRLRSEPGEQVGVVSVLGVT